MAKSKRGLASADEATRREVASKGGSATHRRGRGLQNADKETRQQVARMGGQASRGGGRRSM
jgi:uncharacterized protein